MGKKKKIRSLELAGEELDSFIKDLVGKLYGEIWADLSVGPDEAVIKERLKESIIEALREYVEYKSDE